MDEWTRRLDDDEQAEEIRRWDRHCFILEAVVVAASAIIIGGCTGLAVWLW